MDNFSAEKGEKDSNLKALESGDIEFEEVVDIDELQKNLQKQLAEESSTQKSLEPQIKSSDEDIELEDELESGEKELQIESKDEIRPKSTASILAKPTMEVDPNSKKYVIYVDSDNVNFIENLSINDRRLIINRILREQGEFLANKKKNEKKQRFIRHAILATVTFVIGFPLMFHFVNKAMEITIENYQKAKGNFSKLYKEQGKIKSVGSKSGQSIKY